MNFISHAFHRTLTRGWPHVYIAVDIHDTIFKGTYKKDNEGKQFYPWAKEVLQNLTMNPMVKLIIYTASHEQPARDVISWLKEHHIEIFALNENPDHKGTDLCDFSRKFYFDALLEDKAGFEGWHDWFRIMKELQAIGQWIPMFSDDGVEVRLGKTVETLELVHKGPTSLQYWDLHRTRECDWNCPLCNFAGDQHFEREKYDKERKANSA